MHQIEQQFETYFDPAKGLTVSTPGKSVVFSVTTSRLLASAVAAIRLSRTGSGRPAELTYIEAGRGYNLQAGLYQSGKRVKVLH